MVLGRVLGAHGVRGWIRVAVYGDGPENLLRLRQLALAPDAEADAVRTYEVVESGAGRPGEVRFQLAGVTRREEAEALRGRLAVAQQADLAPLAAGEHYWFELVGCRVQLADGQRVGVVSELWETGAHDLLVIEGEDGRRRLIPAASEFLREVDVEAKRIVIEVIPGLLDPV